MPPTRPSDGHKGTFGRVLIVAGSRGMSGAAVLAGGGALRGGAGLVFLAVPASIQDVVATSEPAYLTVPLTENRHGHWHPHAPDTLNRHLANCDVVAIGPGCGTSGYFQITASRLYQTLPQPLVVDADALNALALRQTDLSYHTGPRVLTPHLGEFSRLTGRTIPEIAANRESLAREFAKKHAVVLLLKGPGTIITDGDRLTINTTGNSGMARGGTGDILTGLIAALIGQKMQPFEAAEFAAHLHGLAGDLAAERNSQPGMTAHDLLHSLPQAWGRIEG